MPELGSLHSVTECHCNRTIAGGNGFGPTLLIGVWRDDG